MYKLNALKNITLALVLGMSVSMAADEAKLEVIAVGAKHAAGDSLVLRITYVNPTASVFNMACKNGPYFVDDFQFELTGPAAKSVGKTAYFQNMIDARKAILSDNSAVIIKFIDPSKELARDVPLSLYYDCTAEGEYTGRVITTNAKDSDGKTLALSGTFKFTIEPPHYTDLWQ